MQCQYKYNANANTKLQTQIKTPTRYNQAAQGGTSHEPASYIDFSTTAGPAETLLPLEDECGDINVKCHVCHTQAEPRRLSFPIDAPGR